MKQAVVVVLLALACAVPLAARAGEEVPVLTVRLVCIEGEAFGPVREPLAESDVEELEDRIDAVAGEEATARAPVLAKKISVTLVRRVAYVRDHGDTGEIAGTVKEGVIANVTPTVDAEGESVSVAATLTTSRVVRPIQSFDTSFKGTKVTIQLPELQVSRVKKLVKVPVGGSVVLPAGGGYLVFSVDR